MTENIPADDTDVSQAVLAKADNDDSDNSAMGEEEACCPLADDYYATGCIADV